MHWSLQIRQRKLPPKSLTEVLILSLWTMLSFLWGHGLQSQVWRISFSIALLYFSLEPSLSTSGRNLLFSNSGEASQVPSKFWRDGGPNLWEGTSVHCESTFILAPAEKSLLVRLWTLQVIAEPSWRLLWLCLYTAGVSIALLPCRPRCLRLHHFPVMENNRLLFHEFGLCWSLWYFLCCTFSAPLWNLASALSMG